MNNEYRPISPGQARMNAFMATLHMVFYYGVAMGIWGFAIKKSFLWFILGGAIVGLLISLFFVAPILSVQRTKEKTRELMFTIGATLGNIAIVIGILGVIVLIIRVIFFH